MDRESLLGLLSLFPDSDGESDRAFVEKFGADPILGTALSLLWRMNSPPNPRLGLPPPPIVLSESEIDAVTELIARVFPLPW